MTGTYLYCDQGSPEWIKERIGKVTGSRVCDVMRKLKRKDGESAERYKYKMELVAEILTGRAMEHYCSPDMERGVELEPAARTEYEMLRGILCDQIGIALHPTIERFASSPDGLIGSEGLIEIKCPRILTHLQYIIDDCVPDDYRWQMLANMACTGAAWCDFISYCPELPEDAQLFIRRIERDEMAISEMEAEILKFNAEVDAAVMTVRERVKAAYHSEFSNAAPEDCATVAHTD